MLKPKGQILTLPVDRKTSVCLRVNSSRQSQKATHGQLPNLSLCQPNNYSATPASHQTAKVFLTWFCQGNGPKKALNAPRAGRVRLFRSARYCTGPILSPLSRQSRTFRRRRTLASALGKPVLAASADEGDASALVVAMGRVEESCQRGPRGGSGYRSQRSQPGSSSEEGDNCRAEMK